MTTIVKAGEYVAGNSFPPEEANMMARENNIKFQIANSYGIDSDVNGAEMIMNTYTLSRKNQFTASGSGNTIVLTTNSPYDVNLAIKRYTAGDEISFKVYATNTSSVTINIDGLGAKAITINGNALVGGELPKDVWVNLVYNGTSFDIKDRIIMPFEGAFKKIILSNNISTPNSKIDNSAGTFIFSDFSGNAYLDAGTIDLTINGVDGLDTGTKQGLTWYYCYAIYNPTTNLSKRIASINNVSPTLPSGFTKYRYIGSLITDGAGNIIQGIWNKDGYFEYNTPVIDFTGTITTSIVARTLTAKPNSRAVINVVYSSTLPVGTISLLYLSDLNKADNSIERLSANIQYKTSGEFQIQTNSSSEIGTRTDNANNTIQISTIGFYDLDL